MLHKIKCGSPRPFPSEHRPFPSEHRPFPRDHLFPPLFSRDLQKGAELTLALTEDLVRVGPMRTSNVILCAARSRRGLTGGGPRRVFTH